MGEFSLTHILLLAMIFLIFFGPSRLPQLGQSLGKAIKGFKQGLSEIDVEAKDIQDNVQINQNKNASMNKEKQTETEKQNS
jgi:twin arginine-targeting protein translocase, TatA/E family